MEIMNTSEIENVIRQRGLKATRPRTVLYGLLREVGGHRTAEELAGLAAAGGYRLSRASIYNVLDDLGAVGLVMVADRGRGPAIYEAADSWHHHFVCRSCGAVIDVPCTVGMKPCIEASVPGAVVDEAQIIVRGSCAACSDQAVPARN